MIFVAAIAKAVGVGRAGSVSDGSAASAHDGSGFGERQCIGTHIGRAIAEVRIATVNGCAVGVCAWIVAAYPRVEADRDAAGE